MPKRPLPHPPIWLFQHTFSLLASRGYRLTQTPHHSTAKVLVLVYFGYFLRLFHDLYGNWRVIKRVLAAASASSDG